MTPATFLIESPGHPSHPFTQSEESTHTGCSKDWHSKLPKNLTDGIIFAFMIGCTYNNMYAMIHEEVGGDQKMSKLACTGRQELS